MFIKTPRTGLVGFVGSVTLDVFAALQGVLSLGSKHDCSFDLQLGGGAVNAARQAQRLLPHAALFAFVGSD
ncbi:MAG: hypothetical protein GY826_11545, partial [Fuerstiella sp.]|nr:hypothetical protein [Fuerstiella sp.]